MTDIAGGPATAEEIMTVAAARALRDGSLCFVGIGLPSAAANLARRLHAPRLVLIYESGTIGSKPDVLPLSIGDGELAETADSVVAVPEIFAYWLQAGRIDVGFLGAAQIDRFANRTAPSSDRGTRRACVCPAPAAPRKSPPTHARSSSSCDTARRRSSSTSTS
jgi:glutaconate CoA-transferase subunit B